MRLQQSKAHDACSEHVSGAVVVTRNARDVSSLFQDSAYTRPMRDSPEAFIMEQEESASTGNEIFDATIKAQWDATKPRGMTETDRRYVEHCRRDFQRSIYEAQRLMYLFAEAVGSFDWFGPDANVMLTNEYDDFAHGIDIVLYFTQENGPSVKIGVDITCAEDVQKLDDKLRGIRKEIRHGSIGTVKYFQVDEAHERTGILHLPRVVLGTDQKTTNMIFDDVAAALEKKQRLSLDARHALQYELTQEMEHQLADFFEESIDAFLTFTFRRRDLDERSGELIKEVRTHAYAVRTMSVEDKVDAPAFSELLDFLAKEERNLRAIDEHLAGNIFAHLEALFVVRNVKKRGRASARPQGERNATVRTLMNPRRSEHVASSSVSRT